MTAALLDLEGNALTRWGKQLSIPLQEIQKSQYRTLRGDMQDTKLKEACPSS